MKKNLIEIRTVSRAVGNYIRHLQWIGKIKTYTQNGYVAYDPNELRDYKKRARRGRPIKIKVEVE